MKWFNDNEVDILPKNMNPPNWPKLRPIEEFWAIVKRKLKKNGGAAADNIQLKQKWDKHANKVSHELVRKLMASIKTRTRQFLRSTEWLANNLIILEAQ